MPFPILVSPRFGIQISWVQLACFMIKFVGFTVYLWSINCYMCTCLGISLVILFHSTQVSIFVYMSRAIL
ncbi:hypothetical protein DFH27DRAFT_556325 [Peziza echinospora]|nr:hypothetical protein DFH27DRAFT_556325 [Peziza echinospora]